MNRWLKGIPIASTVVFMILVKVIPLQTGLMRPTTLILCLGSLAAIHHLRKADEASPIHRGMVAFLGLACLAFWFWPTGAGRIAGRYAASLLYGILFFIAVIPPLLGKDVFTMFFAKKMIEKTVSLFT